jgi:hypothetical protein
MALSAGLHIAAIDDVEHQAIMMELAATLAERIAQGPMPLNFFDELRRRTQWVPPVAGK